MASPGDSNPKIGIDFPSPWLTKILEENFWSQEIIRRMFGSLGLRHDLGRQPENTLYVAGFSRLKTQILLMEVLLEVMNFDLIRTIFPARNAVRARSRQMLVNTGI